MAKFFWTKFGFGNGLNFATLRDSMTKIKFTRRDGLICLLLALITFWIYSPVLKAPFVDYDDNMYIYQNPHVQSGLNQKAVAWAFTTGYAANWHPLTWISHMLDCQLYGLNAGKHHLTNLLFHIANTLLLFGLLRSMTGAIWRSALVAALFAWHPTHVESVAWIAERKDVLSTFFWILTVWAYVAYTRRSGWARYALVMVFYALGLMAKPMLVTLPLILLVLDFWPLGRIYESRFTIDESKDLQSDPQIEASSEPPASPTIRKSQIVYRKLIWEKLPLFAMSIASSLVTYWVQKAGGASSLIQLPVVARITSALVWYVRYLGKIIWPTRLAVLYPIEPIQFWQILGAGLILLVLTIAALRLARRRPYFIAGWFWFLGMLVPVIGLVQVGDQSIADRYLYVPAVGIFIGIVWGVAELMAAWPAVLKWGSGLAVLAGCVLGTCIQVTYWQDSVALFRHTRAVTTNNPVAALGLGNDILRSKGNVKEAMECYAEVMRLRPNDGVAYNGFGLCLAIMDKYSEATNYYAQSLTHKLSKSEAATAHFNYSLSLAALGDMESANIQVLEMVRQEPERADSHCVEAQTFMAAGLYKEAKTILVETLKYRPDYPEAHMKLGLVLTQLGENAAAAEQYQEILRHLPNSVEALNNLAWIRAANSHPELRNGVEAVRLAERACQLTGNTQPALLGTLAAAYAEAGKFADAQATAKKAYDLALASGQNDLATRNQRLLDLYQSNLPFHEVSASAESPKH